MLADEAALPSTRISVSKLAVFLNQGLEIQHDQ
jgi:hypothetical protein